jgi:hypothetical protein
LPVGCLNQWPYSTDIRFDNSIPTSSARLDNSDLVYLFANFCGDAHAGCSGAGDLRPHEAAMQVGNGGRSGLLMAGVVSLGCQKLARLNAPAPDSKCVALGGLYGEVQMWNTITGESLAYWQGS